MFLLRYPGFSMNYLSHHDCADFAMDLAIKRLHSALGKLDFLLNPDITYGGGTRGIAYKSYIIRVRQDEKLTMGDKNSQFRFIAPQKTQGDIEFVDFCNEHINSTMNSLYELERINMLFHIEPQQSTPSVTLSLQPNYLTDRAKIVVSWQATCLLKYTRPLD